MNDVKLSPHARNLLRQQLRAHPEFAAVSVGIDLNTASKETLLDLAAKLGIDVAATVKRAKLGPDAKPRQSSGSAAPKASPSSAVEGLIPLEITITVMGQSKTYDAFMAYEWTASFEHREGEMEYDRGEGRSTFKVLTIATDDDYQQTGKLGPMSVEDDHGSYFSEEPMPIMLSDPKLSRLIPEGIKKKLWDTVEERAISEFRERGDDK